MTLCEQCKHFNVDYVWDDADDEEYEEYTCSLSGEPIDYARQECEHFKKYKPKKYVEKYSECDKCQRMNECRKNGLLVEITLAQDTVRHFMRGLGCICPKEKEKHGSST